MTEESYFSMHGDLSPEERSTRLKWNVAIISVRRLNELEQQTRGFHGFPERKICGPDGNILETSNSERMLILPAVVYSEEWRAADLAFLAEQRGETHRLIASWLGQANVAKVEELARHPVPRVEFKPDDNVEFRLIGNIGARDSMGGYKGLYYFQAAATMQNGHKIPETRFDIALNRNRLPDGLTFRFGDNERIAYAEGPYATQALAVTLRRMSPKARALPDWMREPGRLRSMTIHPWTLRPADGLLPDPVTLGLREPESTILMPKKEDKPGIGSAQPEPVSLGFMQKVFATMRPLWPSKLL